ncbi:MAG: hypothetical protein ABIZ50_00835 [Solirubrobacterales bacterium]
MSALGIACVSVVAAALAGFAFGPELLAGLRNRPTRDGSRLRHSLPDPGRELRAEKRAEQLLCSVLGEDAYEAYRALGFLHAFGPPDEDGIPAYGYLIYPHKPIVSFDVATGDLLNEHCVAFPDRSEPAHGQRLPDADDVLAKWMALRGDEDGLIRAANMNLPGRQLDPDHVRRDLVRLSEWTGRPMPVRDEGRTGNV